MGGGETEEVYGFHFGLVKVEREMKLRNRGSLVVGGLGFGD